MKLLIVASAALAFLCSPALAQMGTHPGARAPSENQKVPPGHTGDGSWIFTRNGAPVEFPDDGIKRLACTELGEFQEAFAAPTLDAAAAILRHYLTDGPKGYPECAASAWGAGKIDQSVKLEYSWNFSDGSHPDLYAIHVTLEGGGHFWVLWLDLDAPTS